MKIVLFFLFIIMCISGGGCLASPVSLTSRMNSGIKAEEPSRKKLTIIIDDLFFSKAFFKLHRPEKPGRFEDVYNDYRAGLKIHESISSTGIWNKVNIGENITFPQNGNEILLISIKEVSWDFEFTYWGWITLPINLTIIGLIFSFNYTPLENQHLTITWEFNHMTETKRTSFIIEERVSATPPSYNHHSKLYYLNLENAIVRWLWNFLGSP